MKKVFCSKTLTKRLNRSSLRDKLIAIFLTLLIVLLLGSIYAKFSFTTSFQQGLWWSWIHILDSGAIENDADSIDRIWMGSIISLFGILLVGSMFITIAEEIAHHFVQTLRQGKFKSGLNNHTLIIGSSPLPIKALVKVLQSEPSTRSETIAIAVPNSTYYQAIVSEFPENDNDNIEIAVIGLDDFTHSHKSIFSQAKRLMILSDSFSQYGQLAKVIVQLANTQKLPEKIEGKSLPSPYAPIDVYLEIDQNSLISSLRMVFSELQLSARNIHMHIVNKATNAARQTLRQYPLDFKAINNAQSDIVSVNILIDGWNQLAQALFWQVVTTAHFVSKPTRIIIVTPNSNQVLQEIQIAAPMLSVDWITKSVLAIEAVDTVHQLPLLPTNRLLTIAVSGDNDDDVFTRAMDYRQRFTHTDTQIYLELSVRSGYRDLLQALPTDIPMYPVHLDMTIGDLEEHLDVVAKYLHETFLKQNEVNGRREMVNGRYKNPANHDWIDLDETRRNWNRTAADHADIKLRTIADLHNIEIVRNDRASWKNNETLIDQVRTIIQSIQDKQANPLVEQLASLEHDRWMTERMVQGWCYAPERNDAKKLSPYLVPYTQLDDATKQYDREVIAIALRYLIS